VIVDHGDGRLDAAVTLGIITADQAQAIRGLSVPSAGRATEHTAEAPRAFNAAMIAYLLGAVTVLIAMAWFVADRWTWLGAGGVLAVAVLYAALFLVVARVLRREGFATASGLAVLFAVAMAPLATVALIELTGWLGLPRGVVCGYPDRVFWACRGEEVLAELVAALAALVALRQVRFSLLVAPLVAIAMRMLFHVSEAINGGLWGDATSGWIWVIGASTLAAAAYAADRRQQGDEDFARWIHAGAAISALVATVQLLNAYEGYRHLLTPGAFVAFAAALTMRRLAWLALGMIWFVWYLGWLASDVFRGTPVFPIVLAAIGLAVIVATVWVQRNATMLMRRFGGVSGDGRPRFPGGAALLLAPAAVALLMLGEGAARDRERREEQRWQTELWRQRAAREAAAARERGDTITRRVRPPETPRRP
jgi:hypothetical protein